MAAVGPARLRTSTRPQGPKPASDRTQVTASPCDLTAANVLIAGISLAATQECESLKIVRCPRFESGSRHQLAVTASMPMTGDAFRTGSSPGLAAGTPCGPRRSCFRQVDDRSRGAIAISPSDRARQPPSIPVAAPLLGAGRCSAANFGRSETRLGRKRHRARTLHGLRARIATKISRLPRASGSTTTSTSPPAASPRSAA